VHSPLELAPDQTIYLISDLHLGDGTPGDAFGSKDEPLRRLLEQAGREADALVIVGDGFDLAEAWSLARIEAAHREVIADLCGLARSMPVYYTQGNHDGTAAGLAGLLPFRFSDRLFIGPRIRVEHGNAFDPRNQPGDRLAFWGSRAHAALERVIRSPVRIPMRKHYCWSTRLGHWIFFRYGLYRTGKAGLLRRLGRDTETRRCREFLDYWGQGEWGDIHALLRPAAALLAEGDLDALVCGHSHQAGQLALGGATYVNTGSWTYGDASYCVYRGGGFEVRDWLGGRRIADEEYRGILGAQSDRSFFDWWGEFYRGWLRYDVPAMDRAARGEH
jgi:UDP-2,3-diacylglucosamine pyrophosphatase LpxH